MTFDLPESRFSPSPADDRGGPAAGRGTGHRIRLRVEAGQTVTVAFQLHTDDLAFYGRDQRLATEAGEFHAWIGGSSETELRTEVRIVASE